MISEQAFDLSAMLLESATESEMAAWLMKHGTTVVYHRGRYWMASHGGFYQPVHWMARLHSDEIAKPSLWCWGYRATLDDASGGAANASLPVHFFDRLDGFDASCYSLNKRKSLKICQKNVEIRPITDLELLVEEGYSLFMSSRERTGYGRHKTPAGYKRDMARYLDAGFVAVLGGFVEGKLGGYLISVCIGKTAYLDTLVVGTDMLKYQIGTGLKYAFIKFWGDRGGPVTEVIDGLHARENPGLCHYKEKIGFKIVRVPSRVWFMPGAEKTLKRLWPHKHYRITGWE